MPWFERAVLLALVIVCGSTALAAYVLFSEGAWVRFWNVVWVFVVAVACTVLMALNARRTA